AVQLSIKTFRGLLPTPTSFRKGFDELRKELLSVEQTPLHQLFERIPSEVSPLDNPHHRLLEARNDTGNCLTKLTAKLFRLDLALREHLRKGQRCELNTLRVKVKNSRSLRQCSIELLLVFDLDIHRVCSRGKSS